MSAPRVQAERTLLAEILLRLRAGAYPVLPLATPNGLYIPGRTAEEKLIRARMISCMRADGMMVAGAPDLVLLWQGGGGLIELKRPASRDIFGYHAAGSASDDQREFARRAARLGINHAYVRSWDGLVERLADWRALP